MDTTSLRTQIPQVIGILVRLEDTPVVRLNRAVAVGEADGPHAGLAALGEVDPSTPRHAAVSAWLHERAGDLELAAQEYAEAARVSRNQAERDHLRRLSARLTGADADD